MSWFVEFGAPDKVAAEDRLWAAVQEKDLPHTVGLFISNSIAALADGVAGTIYVRSAGHVGVPGGDPWNGGSQHTEVRRIH